MQLQRIRVFFNRKASQGGDEKWARLIKRHLFRSHIEVVSPPDLNQLQVEIQRAIDEQVDIIISVGGDGTFHTLIQRLVGSKIRFLVLPAGTANDLARQLGNSRRLQDTFESVRLDRCRGIDAIVVNSKYMATNGGVGLVSEVARSINEMRTKIPGFRRAMGGLREQTYNLVLAYKTLTPRRKIRKIRLTSSEYTGVVETSLLMINNQATVAGNFLIAPETIHDDGRFNVTVLQHKASKQLISAVLRTRLKFPPALDPQILSFETSQVRLESLDGEALDFYGDGEFLTCDRIIDITIKPKALLVYSDSFPCSEPPLRENPV